MRIALLGGKQIYRQICPADFAWVFDPFAGSSTTGIAANLCGRRYCGIEQEEVLCIEQS
ncbi:DNA methyltransferase [Phocaeicola plebeius]|uniref:DNA methyltransferase n=1 Tax=Phocaeicola plebeius TaxID=310297 RepID=UPI00242011C8|nr:DNA methyltransferase [Phocaeicola plebeius]